MTLTPPSLLELATLFERSGLGITSTEGEWLHGIPRWDMQRIASVIAKEIEPWLDCVGYAGEIRVDRGDDWVEVDLQESNEPGMYHYRCPETFRIKPIPASEVAVFAVNPGRFLHRIAELLAIPMALRKGIEAPAIDGVLWHLGKASLGSVQVDIWFARGLALHVEAVFEQLSLPTHPALGIVLITGLPLSGAIKPPRDYRVVSLNDVLIPSVTEPAIDKTVLYQCLIQIPGTQVHQSMPVHWDPYTKTLTLNTRPIPPWVIKGAQQAAVVDYLYRQWLAGRPWIQAQEILKAIYSHNTIRRSMRIPDLFSGNTQWENYLVNNGNGQYGFNLI